MTSSRHLTCAAGAIAVFFATGCASGGGKQPAPDVSVAAAPQQITMASGQNVRFNTSTTTVAVAELIPVGADSAYNLLLKVYADLQIPTTSLDTRMRTVGNSNFKIRRRLGGVTLVKYLDCGNKDGVPNAESYDIVLAINSGVGGSATPGASSISTSVTGTATHPVFSTQTLCSTTGELEKRIAAEVKLKAGRR
jgi:hypothetical protein